MRIVAIALGAFPEGEATTNRVISVLKGLVDLKVEVRLFVLGPTRKLLKGLRLREGVVEGVEFKYLSKAIIYPGTMIFWLTDLLFAVLKLFKILLKLHATRKIDSVLLLMHDPLMILTIMVYCKILKIKTFHEVTETPEIVFSQSTMGNIMFRLYIMLIRRMTGLYVINNYLRDYFMKYIDCDKICVLNITVIPQRFQFKPPSPFNFEYIAYTGTMYGEKDGINDLLKVYSLVQDQINLKLVLIGDVKDYRVTYVKEMIRDLGLSEKVILTGSISSSEIPKYLMNAKLLILTRPNNTQSKGGFPSKLGEYLLSGKPVLITRVGEISLFLNDGVNAFIAEPGNICQIAEKLLFIINNYEHSLKIAENGKFIALANFNYLVEANKLIHFLQKT